MKVVGWKAETVSVALDKLALALMFRSALVRVHWLDIDLTGSPLINCDQGASMRLSAAEFSFFLPINLIN